MKKEIIVHRATDKHPPRDKVLKKCCPECLSDSLGDPEDGNLFCISCGTTFPKGQARVVTR